MSSYLHFASSSSAVIQDPQPYVILRASPCGSVSLIQEIRAKAARQSDTVVFLASSGNWSGFVITRGSGLAESPWPVLIPNRLCWMMSEQLSSSSFSKSCPLQAMHQESAGKTCSVRSRDGLSLSLCYCVVWDGTLSSQETRMSTKMRPENQDRRDHTPPPPRLVQGSFCARVLRACALETGAINDPRQ